MSRTNDSAPTKSPVNPKRRFRILRAVLVLAAGLMTLVALFYAEENWRGRRAWLAYKRQFEARGGSLDLKSVIPPAVPDDQNFAMTPLFKSFYDYEPGTQTRRDKSPIDEWIRPYWMLLMPLPTGKLKALEPIVSKDRQWKMAGNWYSAMTSYRS